MQRYYQLYTNPRLALTDETAFRIPKAFTERFTLQFSPVLALILNPAIPPKKVPSWTLLTYTTVSHTANVRRSVQYLVTVTVKHI